MSHQDKPGADVRPEMPGTRSSRRWVWGSAAMLSAACMAGALYWDAVLTELTGDPKSQTASSNFSAYPTGAIAASGIGDSYSTEGWTYLGPNGGSTSSIATDPGNPNVAYAISEMGAVFKSTTGGSNWEFIHQLPMQNAKLEVSAAQPGTLYAYTNYAKDTVNAPNGILDEANPTVGIHKSEDGGASWVEIQSGGSEVEGNGSAALKDINRIRTVPGLPNVLFAAGTTGGLMRSADAGATWQYVRDGNFEPFSDCTELEVAPAKNKLYAVCAKQPVVVQTNGSGATRLFEPDLADSSEKLKLAVAQSNQDVIYLAATKASQGHSRLITRIYRSTDAGATWETRFRRTLAGETPTAESSNPFNIALPGMFDRDCENPQPFNFFEEYQLAVDPSDANSLWIAGGQTYRSDDGGRTFGRAVLEYDTGKAGLAFSSGYDGVNSQIVFTAGPGGIRRATNARAAIQTYPTVDCGNQYEAAEPAVAWEATHDGYSAAMLLHGATHQYHSFAASLITPSMLHQGTYVGNDQSVNSWRQFHWLPSQVVISPHAQLDEIYTGDWAVQRWGYDPVFDSWGFFDGPTMPYPTMGFVYPARKDSPAYYRQTYRLVQHPTNASALLIPTVEGMYVSTDRGASFSLRGPPAVMQTATFTRDGGVLGVSLDNEFISENPVGSGNWEKRNLAGCLMGQGNQCEQQTAWIQEFVLSPVPDSKAIYAVGNAYGRSKVYYSTDGRTWTALDRPGSGLPDYAGMTTLAVDPSNPKHLYVGTPFGLYASVDHGQNWAPMATPFPLTPVSKLVFDRDASGNRRLFAFTYGRGAWAYQVPPSTVFADVPGYHWAYDYVDRLFRAGITTGCATGPLRYCPDQQVLRDQMAVFLLRAKYGSSYQPPPATGYFADVPVNHWAAAWIEQLRVEGITQGCATNPARYCPGDQVQRDQMAVFLLRAKYGAANQTPPPMGMFEDVPQSYWAAPWIEQLAREGVTTGCSATPKLYCPANTVTRDQMAVFLVRTFGL